jgi:2-haloalkanoic acid dehalogenase type II
MPHFEAVLFDLLTGLLDSWTLWNAVAGNEDDGRRWRAAYLRITYDTGAYRPYEELVAQAAVAVGLDRRLADDLALRYGELKPWPDVAPVLSELVAAGIPLGIVTNCSRRLGHIAVRQTGIAFRHVVTAEEVGWYKPDPRAYGRGLELMGVSAERCLFVAGSAYDLIGTAKLGMPVYWHDRVGMTPPIGAPKPIAHERSLADLPACCGL